MSELEKLRKEFDQKKKVLQDSCPHPELTDWIEEWWAIAHPTGYEIKLCKRCGLEVERRGGFGKDE